MSTTAVEAGIEPQPTRRNGRGRSAPASVRPELVETRQHTEQAVAHLITATTDMVRSFVPNAVLRPTEAVDYAFDLAEQMLTASRRICLEVASVLESGLQGAEQRAA